MDNKQTALDELYREFERIFKQIQEKYPVFHPLLYSANNPVIEDISLTAFLAGYNFLMEKIKPELKELEEFRKHNQKIMDIAAAELSRKTNWEGYINEDQ